MAFQVASAKRPLLAVYTPTRTGNGVALMPEGGTITSRKTGRTIAFANKGGVHVLEVTVDPPPGQDMGDPPKGGGEAVGGARAIRATSRGPLAKAARAIRVASRGPLAGAASGCARQGTITEAIP